MGLKSSMIIKNIEKSSMVDHPPYISAVIFVEGCDFRCPICFNHSIIDPNSNTLPPIPEKEIIDWLKTRKGKIDSVSISGGECTLYENELINLIKKIKSIGYMIKIDTNGSRPKVLKRLIDNGMIDFISMDIKTSKDRYNETCGTIVNINDIEESIKIIIKSCIDHEFRTTIHPRFHCKKYILDIAEWIKGAKTYSLQQYIKVDVLDPSLNDMELYDTAWFKDVKKAIETTGNIGEIRIKDV